MLELEMQPQTGSGQRGHLHFEVSAAGREVGGDLRPERA